MELAESRWGGHNSQVTEANVRSIDLANGGGAGRPRFVNSSNPQFRPVASYEAGRAPMGSPDGPEPRSGRLGGFFRNVLFGGSR
jgi:hypothetical protein